MLLWRQPVRYTPNYDTKYTFFSCIWPIFTKYLLWWFHFSPLIRLEIVQIWTMKLLAPWYKNFGILRCPWLRMTMKKIHKGYMCVDVCRKKSELLMYLHLIDDFPVTFPQKWFLREEKQGDLCLILHQAQIAHFPSKYKITGEGYIDSHVVCQHSDLYIKILFI